MNSGSRKRKFSGSGSTSISHYKHVKSIMPSSSSSSDGIDALAKLDDLLREEDVWGTYGVGQGDESGGGGGGGSSRSGDSSSRRMSISDSSAVRKESEEEHEHAAAVQETPWLSMNHTPLDWSLKRSMEVTSSWSFDWLDSVGEADKSLGLAASFHSSPSYACEEEDEEADVHSHGVSRVRTWRHVMNTAENSSNKEGDTKKQLGVKRRQRVAGSGTTSALSSSYRELHRSMTYHVHPSGPLPAPMLALKRLLSSKRSSNNSSSGSGSGNRGNSGDSGNHGESRARRTSLSESVLSQFFTTRRKDWREAFIGLYTMLKMGRCDHFYYRTAHTTVLFKRHSTKMPIVVDDEEDMESTTTTLCAVMSPSTKKLRSDLGVRDVPFAMPMLPGGVLSESEMLDRDEIVRELKALKASSSSSMSQSTYVKTKMSKKGSSIMDKSTGLESTLTFVGMWSLDGLFDYLLDYGVKVGQRHNPGQLFDVPELLSETPFRNSSNRMIGVMKNTSVLVPPNMQGKETGLRPASRQAAATSLSSSSTTSSSSTAGANVRVHKVEFAGPLLPTMIPKMLTSLLRCQRERISLAKAAIRRAAMLSVAEEEVEVEVEVEVEEEDWVDLNVDFRSFVASFGHNIVNDVCLATPTKDDTKSSKGGSKVSKGSKGSKGSKEKTGRTTSEDGLQEEEEPLVVERLGQSSIVRMNVSSKKTRTEVVAKKTRRRSSRGSKNSSGKKKMIEKEEIQIRYLTKDDPSSRLMTR